MKNIEKMDALAKRIAELTEQEAWFNQGALAVLSGKYDLVIQKAVKDNKQKTA